MELTDSDRAAIADILYASRSDSSYGEQCYRAGMAAGLERAAAYLDGCSITWRQEWASGGSGIKPSYGSSEGTTVPFMSNFAAGIRALAKP